MLVADALLVDPDSLNCENAILLAQPSSIELVVRNDEQEDDADRHSQKSSKEEDNLPPS